MNYIGGYKIIDLADGAAVCYKKIKDNQAHGNKPVLVKGVEYTIGVTTYTMPPAFLTVSEESNSNEFYLMACTDDKMIGVIVTESYIIPNVISPSLYSAFGALDRITARVPNPPTTDGAYVLTCTVTDGEPAYTWETA